MPMIGTQMSTKITPRSEDFSQWYHDVISAAKLADYSPVKGCMVIRPNGYAIWERIQRELDARIKATGARNAYFPLFIPESFLKKEAEHVEGFAPECAVVTHAGGKLLEEPLVVRPTSETIINSMFAKWIQSYRDLPMMVNQWANVVRWEMRTRLFLRTTEFLWQEGHTCHSTAEEAELETRTMLQVYRKFSEDILAMPVDIGRKSDAERFAGALRTYCIEAMMQDKKALQAGTSHNLSTKFAEAFETKFLDKDSVSRHVHQTSWGVSTRLIGGVIMTHSDDKGLVLPPTLAFSHGVVIPILGKAETRERVLKAGADIVARLQEDPRAKTLGYPLQVSMDADETKQPGWKYFEYEATGNCIRIEVGPRDLDAGKLMIVRRDLGVKEAIPMESLPDVFFGMLTQMQSDLTRKAEEFKKEHTYTVASYEELKERIEQGGFFVAAWDQDPAIEQKIKQETKATIRCLPLTASYELTPHDGPALISGKTGPGVVKAIFARSY